LKCKNGHEFPSGGGLQAEFCPTCGARVRASHPFALGVALGFGASVWVSALELLGTSYTFYTADTPVAWALLLAAAPAVLVLTGGTGAAYLKFRYGNIVGLGRVVWGSVPMVVMFAILWAFVLIFLSLFACVGTC
jgi:hypothetical protein